MLALARGTGLERAQQTAQAAPGLAAAWGGAGAQSFLSFFLSENTRHQHVHLHFNITIAGEFKAKSKTTSPALAAPRLIRCFL